MLTGSERLNATLNVYIEPVYTEIEVVYLLPLSVKQVASREISESFLQEQGFGLTIFTDELP